MTPDQIKKLMARATRPRRTVPIVLDGELRERIEAAQAELDEAQPQETGDDRRLNTRRKQVDTSALTARLDALFEEANESTLLLVVEGLPGHLWDALREQYPARKDSDGKLIGPYVFDGKPMKPALVRAALIGSRASLDAEAVTALPDGFIDWLLDFASQGQMELLFQAALGVTAGTDAVPLRRALSTALTSDGE